MGIVHEDAAAQICGDDAPPTALLHKAKANLWKERALAIRREAKPRRSAVVVRV
jgi:hypothetical protein